MNKFGNLKNPKPSTSNDDRVRYGYRYETQIIHGQEIKVKVFESQADKVIKELHEKNEAASTQRY